MRTTVSRWTCVAALAAAFAASSLSGCYSAGGWSMPRMTSLNPMNWGKNSAGSSLASKNGSGYPSPPSTQMQPTPPNSSLVGGSGRPAAYQNQAGGGQTYAAQQTGAYNSNPYGAGGAGTYGGADPSQGGAAYTADQRNSGAYGQPPAGAQNPYGTQGTGSYGAGSYGAGASSGYGAGGYGQGAGAYGQGAPTYGQGAGTSGQAAGAYGQGAGSYSQPDAGSYGQGAGAYGQPSYDAGSGAYGTGGSSYGAGGAYGSGGDANSGSGDYGSSSGAYGSGSYGGGYGATQPASKSSASETGSTQTASLNLPGELLQRSGDYAPGSIRRTQLASATSVNSSTYGAGSAASFAKTSESGGGKGGGPLPGFGMPSLQ